VFHLNDSKKPCGSRVDRHEHIGKGCLGLEPFRRLLNDPRFVHLPMLLETPKLETAASKRRSDVDPWDARNLRTLRKLIGTV
jgi:deoxyribonuclease IV